MGDDPPYLQVGTEVSAKYRGAFCEAKIRKVVRVVKCKVTYKGGLGSATLSDDNIKGDLRVGAVVEAKCGDKTVEATINKIQDCSQYTVVFDDGDITTLRRSALCLKSGRHFNESETLDQLPLTHPEHFSNPVVGGRRGARRRLQNNEEENESSEEEEPESSKKGRTKLAKEVDMGKIVCVESSEKKKGKDSWFPGLVVSPSAQETVKIRVKDEYLVRSFKDGRYYTVPKKETTDFARDSMARSDHVSSMLRSACDKAMMFMEKNELPPHWDRDVLFGLGSSSTSEDAVSESEMSEEDPREEKDRFVAQLYKFMDERQTPINKVPTVSGRDLDLYKLYKIVTSKGGYNKVTNGSQWKPVAIKLGFAPAPSTATVNLVKQAYKKFLQNFEEINRKLGCSLSSLSQGSLLGKSRSNRTLIRGSGSSKEDRKEQQHVKVELEFESVSADEGPGESEQGDTESIASELSKGRDASVERLLDEPRRSRSRQDKSESRSIKKEPEDDKSDKGTGGKQKRLSKKKHSISEVKEKDREGATTPVSAASPVPSTGSAKRGSTRVKTVKKELDLGSEESPDHVGKGVKISVGDKLRVYYGPKSKGNVTYEAKVIDARVTNSIPEFLVHYNGWNSRYDEWISRNRIAKVISNGKRSGDDDQDNSDNKSTPKGTGKRKGSKIFSGTTPFRKGSLKSSKRKDGQSSGSEGETSDSEMKPLISTPPSSVGPLVTVTQKPSRVKKVADDDDASSVASSASSVPTALKGKRGSVSDIKAKVDAGSSSPETKQVDMGNDTPKQDKSLNLPPGEVKLDIYEFDDDLGEPDAPGPNPTLKIYSPRSPEKKDEAPVKSPEDKGIKEEPAVTVVKEPVVPAKTEPVKKEKPEAAVKEAKTPKVKKESKKPMKTAETPDNAGKVPPAQKKQMTKEWNAVVTASLTATTLPVAAIVKSSSSLPLVAATIKPGAVKPQTLPKARNFLQVTTVSSAVPHASSTLSTAGQPVKLLPKPRPSHLVGTPMVNTTIQRVTLAPSPVAGGIRNLEPQSSLLISHVPSSTVLIRPAATVIDAKSLYHSPPGPMVSVASLGLGTSSVTPVTVITPSGQIFHPTQQQASIGTVEQPKQSVTVTTSSLTMTSVPSVSSSANILTTPEKKSPSKRKLAQDDKGLHSVKGSPYLPKSDPTHLPPKKKVKKVVTKNIIDLRPDEAGKERITAVQGSPEKKPRKPAKKRIKQDGLMDSERPFSKSPSKSPKKKKLDNVSPSPASSDKLKITSASPIFTTSSTTITSSVPLLGSSNIVADYHKSSPLELHLTGTVRPESSGTIPKIDVKVVKCSTVPGTLLPDQFSSQMDQNPGPRYSNEGMSLDEAVPIARMFPPQSPSASYEYITLQASTPEKNDGSPSPVTILASSTPSLRTTPKPVVEEALSFTNKIITESLLEAKPVSVLPLRSDGSSGKSVSPVVTASSISVVKTEVKEESTGVMSVSKTDETTATKVNVVSIKVTSERQVSSEVLPIEDANTSIPVVSIKEIEPDEKDLSSLSAVKDEESCHSLLCEEEIPGSPPPGADFMFGLDDDSRANSPPPKFGPVASKSSSEESTYKELSFTSKLEELAEAGMQVEAKEEEAKKKGPSGRGGYGGKNQDRFAQGRGAGDRMPLGGFDRRPGGSGLHNVMDNTPPTTPESSSLSSGSPRVDNGRISPSNDLPGSGKSKDSSDIDSLKLNEEESSNDAGRKSSKDISPGKKVETGRWSSRAISPPGKRKRIPRRRSPDEVVKSYGTYRGRGGNTPRKGDREDNVKPAPAPPPINLVKPPMSKKFNLIPDLDDGMESEQRVLVLQQALQSIRDKYHEIRQELSSEERRLKRYKRRQKEREKEKTKHAQKASM